MSNRRIILFLTTFAAEFIIFVIMNAPEAIQPAKSDPPKIPLKTFLAAVANPARWHILRELSGAGRCR